MTDIVKYFESNQVRLHINEHNALWFCGMDVCHILTIKNHNDALSSLPERQKCGVGITDPIGRVQETTFVNLSGLLRLIFKSRKPEAERLQDWTFDEVLPEVLTTGTYRGKKPSAAASLRAAEAAFKVALRITKLLKLPESTAVLSANNATEKLTGCNLLDLMSDKEPYTRATIAANCFGLNYGVPREDKPEPAERTKPVKPKPINKAKPAGEENIKKETTKGVHLHAVEAQREKSRREKEEDKLVREQIDLMRSSKRK